MSWYTREKVSWNFRTILFIIIPCYTRRRLNQGSALSLSYINYPWASFPTHVPSDVAAFCCRRQYKYFTNLIMYAYSNCYNLKKNKNISLAYIWKLMSFSAQEKRAHKQYRCIQKITFLYCSWTAFVWYSAEQLRNTTFCMLQKLAVCCVFLTANLA